MSEAISPFLSGTWTGATGQNVIADLAFDETYIYASLITSPGKVVKINRASMATVAVWTAPAGVNSANVMTYDGSHLYVGFDTANVPTKIIKVDPATMATVATYVCADETQTYCLSIAYDNDYIYVAPENHANGAAYIFKVDKTTMLAVDSWSGGDTVDQAVFLTMDATRLYALVPATANNGTSTVFKINPATMETDGSPWVGVFVAEDYPLGQYGGAHLTYDGTALYASLSTIPAQVVRINPATMATVSAWIAGEGDDEAVWAAYSEDYLYVTTSVGGFHRVAKATMLTAANFTPATTISSVAFDGIYAYGGDGASPAHIYRIGFDGKAVQHDTDAAFLETNKDEIIDDDTAILAEFGVTGTAAGGTIVGGYPIGNDNIGPYPVDTTHIGPYPLQ